MLRLFSLFLKSGVGSLHFVLVLEGFAVGAFLKERLCSFPVASLSKPSTHKNAPSLGGFLKALKISILESPGLLLALSLQPLTADCQPPTVNATGTQTHLSTLFLHVARALSSRIFCIALLFFQN